MSKKYHMTLKSTFLKKNYFVIPQALFVAIPLNFFFRKTLISDFEAAKQLFFSYLSPHHLQQTFQVLTTWTTTSCHALLKRCSNLDIGTPKWPTFHLKNFKTTAAAFLKSDSNKCITCTLCTKLKIIHEIWYYPKR